MKPSGARAQADNRSTSEGLTMIVVVTGKNAIVKEGDDCSRLHIETDTGVEATDAALRAAELGRLRGRVSRAIGFCPGAVVKPAR